MGSTVVQFSRDGGETWEPLGVMDVKLCIDGGEFPEEPGVIVVGGRGGMAIRGSMTCTFFHSDLTVPEVGYLDPQCPGKPWLRPKKGRGRQL